MCKFVQNDTHEKCQYKQHLGNKRVAFVPLIPFEQHEPGNENQKCCVDVDTDASEATHFPGPFHDMTLFQIGPCWVHDGVASCKRLTAKAQTRRGSQHDRSLFLSRGQKMDEPSVATLDVIAAF